MNIIEQIEKIELEPIELEEEEQIEKIELEPIKTIIIQQEEQIEQEEKEEIKTIIIQQIDTSKRYKKEEKEKEKEYKEKNTKLRVETKTWNISKEELIHNKQIESLKNIKECKEYKECKESNAKYKSKIISHIKMKISSYKSQDMVKKKYNEIEFITFNDVVELLIKCNLTCCYCSKNVYILYENVREINQWTLDRINNDIGHDKNNLLIACLDCNLKRRRINKDAFMFTKNMIITKI
jgi:hypothetical protein